VDPTHVFEGVIAMLLAIIALHYGARKLCLPPSVALLAGGAALAFVPGLPVISLDPGLVLVIFLPPLLMDGAWSISLGHLKRHSFGIASLAIGAVVFTTVVVAVVTHVLLPALPWAACAALGAIVSPPDAVSARVVLQRVKMPRRLLILLEGESLFNDASGLVLFRFAIAASVTSVFSASDAIGSFFILAIGGALVGLAVGAAWALLLRRLGDEYLMVATSILTPWAAYLFGDLLHVSGVIATVTTGLVLSWNHHTIMSASVRMRGGSFWTVMIFLMEASVFMLIGSSLRGVVERVGGYGVVIDQMAKPILLIVLALTLARFAWVFVSDVVIVICRALGMRRHAPLGARCATVLSWAGMRGVVTLALALSLPEGFAGRDFILITAFAVILATVLIQGTSLGPMIRWLKLREKDSEKPRLSISQAEATMAQAQLRVIEQRVYGEDGTLEHPMLLEQYRRRVSMSAKYVGQEEQFAPRLHAHFDLVLEAIAAGRVELLRLHRAGDINEAILRELEHDLDLEELSSISAKS
jgi:monovalent cation/hydrogen antiporter